MDAVAFGYDECFRQKSKLNNLKIHPRSRPFSSLSQGRSFMTSGRSSYQIGCSSSYNPRARSGRVENVPKAALLARSRTITFSLEFSVELSDWLHLTRTFGTSTTASCRLVIGALSAPIFGVNFKWT